MTKFLTAISIFFSSVIASVYPSTTTQSLPTVLGTNTDQMYFTINTPANFKQGFTAPNVLYSITKGQGINITGNIQNPTIENSGVLSLQGQTGNLSLTAGDGIALDGLKIINTGIKSLSAGDGISIDGNKITNTGILSLSAGDGISIDGNKITNTREIPNYALTGWTDTGDNVRLTDLTDSVLIDAVTFGNISLTSGHNLIPDTDLGSDLGSSTLRFDNLMVANIFSNHSQNFSGQSTFSYAPKDNTFSEASVIINPTTSAAGGQLLGLSLGGFEKATIDKDGDLIIGYSGNTSTSTTDYPLNIYGHSGTSVAHFDTSGNLTMGNTLTTSGTLNINGGANTQNLNVNSGVLSVTDKVGIGTTNPSEMLTVNGGIDATSIYTQSLGNNILFGNSADTISVKNNGSTTIYIDGTGNVGIGTTTPSAKLDVAGTATISGATTMGSTLNVSGTTTLNSLTASSAILGNFAAQGNTTIAGKLGIGTTEPTSSLDIATQTNVDALRLTNSGVKVLGMSTGANNSVAMDISSQSVTNRLTNSTFESNLTGWTGSQTYSLNDEFTDTAPTTLATSAPVTIQSGGVSNPTPVMGNELVTNGDMETGNPPTGWNAFSSNISESSDAHSGSQSLYISSTGTPGYAQRSVTISNNSWFAFSVWAKIGSQGLAQAFNLPNANSGLFITYLTSPSYSNYYRTGRMSGTNTIVKLYSGFNGSLGDNAYFDDVSMMSLTLSSLFSTVPVTSTSTDYTVQADATLTAGTQAGLVINLDSTSSPSNFIIAYHDGTKVYLDKAVAGTYTNLINTSATYVPGATIKIVKNGFNYSLYYNGVQKGTTQVITDAGIVNNTNHGVFSTYATNSFTNFLVQSQVSNPTPTTGSEMWDAPASAFTTGTYAWIAFSANTLANVNNALQIAYADSTYGAYDYFKDAADINSNLTVGFWYSFSALASTNTGTANLRVVAASTTDGSTITTTPSTVSNTFRSSNSTDNSQRFTNLEAGEVLTIDNLSLKPLTLSSLFSTVNAGNQNVVASTSATLTAGTQAGLVLNLDSTSNPQNFIIAYHDGTNMHLDKAVSGTYTSLINTAATYVAGANITVRKNGTRYTLVYNGTQVGTDQTISDAGIINNTIHGLFSTYSGNTFTNFSIKTNLDGSLATDGISTRIVNDTKGYESINSGKLTYSNGYSSYTDPALWESTVINRSAGKIFTGNIFIPNNTNTARFGVSTSLGSQISEGININYNNLTFLSNAGGINTSVGSIPYSTLTPIAIVFKNTGSYLFAKVSGVWNLLFTSNIGTSPSYYAYANNHSIPGFAVDNINSANSTWLPTPLAYDTFTATGSASTETIGPDLQTTPQLSWTGGTKAGGTMSITPTTGTETAPDNTATSTITEADATTGWTPGTDQGNTVTLTSLTDNRPGSLGTKSMNMLSNAGNLYAYYTYGGNAGTWYAVDYWYKNESGNYTAVYDESTASNPVLGYVFGQTSWTEKKVVFKSGSSAKRLRLYTVTANKNILYDDISVKPLVPSSLFSTVSTSDSDVIADTDITLTSGTQAGLVLNLDSTSSPSNFIIVYSDGTNIKVDEAVAGVYTNKQTTAHSSATALNYAAGRTLRAIKDGNKLRVYYNNTLVGAELTMTANTNTTHGLFSTYSGNTFDNFTLWPRGTGGEFAQLTPEDLTVTRDTTVKFAGSTSSAKIVAGGTDNDFTQMVNVGDTSTYTLTTYAYTNGSAVTSGDLQLYYSSTPIATTYTPLGGDGWYRLQGTVTGIASNQPVGVRVKAGRTVYVDNITLSNGVATPTTMYVFNSGTGKANLNVQGLIDGTLGGIATFSKAGTIGDSDFSSVSNGLMGIDTLNHRLYFRENGTWSYIARTGGFQIPVEEAGDMSEGDLLLPYVESKMSDGALHGLYRKFSDISQSGTINIPKDADHIDVIFSNPFIKSPIVNITSHSSLGRGASVTNISSTKFTISLDLPALTDYTYSWKAILVSDPQVTQSQSILSDFMKALEASPSSTTSHSVLDSESIQINTSLSSTPSSNLQ